MAYIYQDYYKEVKDDSGKIVDIEISYDDSFNFAYDVIDRYAKEEPQKLALVHRSAEGEDRRFSFSEMKYYSDKAANMLKDLGVQQGDSVMLLLKRRFEYWISILAIHKLGAVAIPTSHMVSAEDIGQRVRLAGAKVVICVNSDQICAKVEEALEESDTLQLVVGDKYKDKPSFDTLLANASEQLERVSTKVSDDMLYYFTSGTSGEPKAVIHDYSYPIAHIYTAKN